MQYMILIYHNEANWASMPPAVADQAIGAFIAYTQELAQSGAMRTAGQLQPSATATTVRVQNGKVHTTDGPYAETKEQLGGYYVIDVPTLDDAVAWAGKCPAAMDGSIEIRPLVPVG